ncbi:MAG TPA: transcription termination/antitermination NusG family protein [Rhodopila sp.]|jgi:transcription antitermination factor NusG|nr:transcription termination/antitermination NusG family protein [Rhodopila sp.]
MTALPAKKLLTNTALMPETSERTLAGSLDTSRPTCSAFQPLRWYVIEAEHQKINLACRSLIEQGFEVFLPTAPVRIRERIAGRRSGAFTVVPRPMFFQFLFVQFDPAAGKWPARDTRLGIRRLLVTASHKPAPVERGLVEQLIETAPQRLRLPEKASPKITRDTNVLVVRGPFEGQVGPVESCDGYTTVVWLNLFGGRTKVTLRRTDVTDE